MSVDARIYRAGMGWILAGNDLASADIKAGFLTDAELVSESLDNIDGLETVYTFAAAYEFAPIMGAWTFDTTTRELQFETAMSIIASGLGSPVVFQHVVIWEDTDDTPLVLYSWPTEQTMPTTEDTIIPIEVLFGIRLVSGLEPTPLLGIAVPLILKDADDDYRRITGAGVSDGSQNFPTTEVDDREAWLYSPNGTLWKLLVAGDGALTTTSVGTPADDARIFDMVDRPCRIPNGITGATVTLAVSNAGVLSEA